MGGFFADPVNNLSWLFGPESIFGGKNGVEWMENWPYAFPNILSALILSVAAISVFLGLDEVSSRSSLDLECRHLMRPSLMKPESTGATEADRPGNLWQRRSSVAAHRTHTRLSIDTTT